MRWRSGSSSRSSCRRRSSGTQLGGQGRRTAALGAQPFALELGGPARFVPAPRRHRSVRRTSSLWARASLALMLPPAGRRLGAGAAEFGDVLPGCVGRTPPPAPGGLQAALLLAALRQFALSPEHLRSSSWVWRLLAVGQLHVQLFKPGSPSRGAPAGLQLASTSARSAAICQAQGVRVCSATVASCVVSTRSSWARLCAGGLRGGRSPARWDASEYAASA